MLEQQFPAINQQLKKIFLIIAGTFMLIAVHKKNQCCSMSKTSLDTVYL